MSTESESEIIVEGKDRHILIAVDDTENSKRAVLYVADMLGGLPGFAATVLHIIPEPPPEYFKSGEQRVDWREEREEAGGKLVENYREILIQAGFGKDKVATEVLSRQGDSVAGCIFEEAKRLGACTVAVGRRGISKKEEFLFGSTSNKIIHTARNCAVWVVE